VAVAIDRRNQLEHRGACLRSVVRVALVVTVLAVVQHSDITLWRLVGDVVDGMLAFADAVCGWCLAYRVTAPLSNVISLAARGGGRRLVYRRGCVVRRRYLDDKHLERRHHIRVNAVQHLSRNVEQ